MSRSSPPRPSPAAADSPCVNVCQLHPDGSHCVGCFRTGEEIAGWSTMSAAQRRAVLARLDERRATRRRELRERRRARRAPT